MTYYNPQVYAERYAVPFADVNGVAWRISIQQPNYSGSVTQLLGDEFPIEWMGMGDESQDDVVLGSTGTMRLICRGTDITNGIFVQGALLPKYINDRRVQVIRMVGQEEQVYWQGFIQPQTFTQDWDAAPYQVELPVVSAVAAMEYFPMPMPYEAAYADFDNVTNIANLLRAIFKNCGCEVMNVQTNKPIYEDFNGQQQYSSLQAVHWTQGIISPSYFYTSENGIVKPKTFKDVLETIAYPFGKIQDYSRNVAFIMRWCEDVEGSMYRLPIWDDYSQGTLANSVRFTDATAIDTVPLSDIITEGTDNKLSDIMAPSSFSFDSEDNYDKTIFELTDKSIKSSLPLNGGYSGKPIRVHVFDGEGKNRVLYAINRAYINLDCASDWRFYNGNDQKDSENFCRVVEVTGDDTEKTYSIAKTVGLGLSFNLSGISEIGMTLPMGIRSVDGAMNVKMTVTPYIFDILGINAGGPSYNATLKVAIFDISNGMFLNYANDAWRWEYGDLEQPIFFSVSNMHNDGSAYVLWFNENRAAGDNALHRLRIIFRSEIVGTLPSPSWGKMFCGFKLEYEENKFMVEEGGLWTYPIQAAMSALADGITNRATVTGEGSNDSEHISLKTRAGLSNAGYSLPTIPHNSFCDYPAYIDKKNRKQLEISAATYDVYHSGYGNYDLVGWYCPITDGGNVYLPVAVGMNPRMSTIRLRLVTTNVTTE